MQRAGPRSVLSGRGRDNTGLATVLSLPMGVGGCETKTIGYTCRHGALTVFGPGFNSRRLHQATLRTYRRLTRPSGRWRRRMNVSGEYDPCASHWTPIVARGKVSHTTNERHVSRLPPCDGSCANRYRLSGVCGDPRTVRFSGESSSVPRESRGARQWAHRRADVSCESP